MGDGENVKAAAEEELEDGADAADGGEAPNKPGEPDNKSDKSDVSDPSDDDSDESDDSDVIRRPSRPNRPDSFNEPDEPDARDDGDGGDEANGQEVKSQKGSSSESESESEKEEEKANEKESESESDREIGQPAPVYDFDIMMAKKKEENSRKRKKRNYDIINDNDDIIADIINQMREAVEFDNEANKNRTAATNKLKLLPFVMSQLRKVDLREAFLDSEVLSTISEWLTPLPDRSLPHLNIRESLLKVLIDFNLYDVDRIKSSGIGKAVMYLYKHPKETKENKQRAKHLISCWSRPIFNLEASFTAISREEREERDLELMKRQRRVSQQDTSDTDAPGPSSAQKKPKETEPVAQKPGEKGWIPRARVPAPSMRDYVVRPHSKVEGDIGRNSKRPTNTLERMMKVQQERKRASKQQRAVKMKIDRI